jgi:quinolinate synthase
VAVLHADGSVDINVPGVGIHSRVAAPFFQIDDDDDDDEDGEDGEYERVLMPELEATCSLDLGCPPEQFNAFCDAHPDRQVVVYANTSAAVKARADWLVTSSCALDIVRALKDKGQKILWAPDKHLGGYIQRETGADMVFWEGACIVHDEFKGFELGDLKKHHPGAKILVHPEAPAEVIAQADAVGSTSGILQAARELDAREFIVATEPGIIHQMEKAAPELTYLPLPGADESCNCNNCPYMRLNTLQKIYVALRDLEPRIEMDEALRVAALAWLGAEWLVAAAQRLSASHGPSTLEVVLAHGALAFARAIM